MNESAINLLLQIPLAGVVVLVVILFLRHLKDITIKHGEQQDKTIAILADQQQKFTAATASQTASFLIALREEKEASLRLLKDLTEQLRDLSNLIDRRLNQMNKRKDETTPRER